MTTLGNSRQSSQRKKRIFLSSYAALGLVGVAARAAGIERRTHYDWLKDDPEYEAAFAEAKEEACEALEREAHRRAVEGWMEPVYQGGHLVGEVKKHSDVLLIFTMKGAMPDKYRENIRAEVGGIPGGAPITVTRQTPSQRGDDGDSGNPAS